MKFLSNVFPVSFFLLPVLFSCSVARPTYYLKDLKKDTIISNVAQALPVNIKKSDLLTISISSLSKEEDAFFNKATATGSGSNAAGSAYLVDGDGNITLHKVGKVKAAGMNREELRRHLEQLLQPYLKDAMVEVNFANHYITLIGDVNKPQLISLSTDQMSILDALALSNNPNASANLQDVVIVREKGADQKEIKHINLEDHRIFTSSWYYLQPNDVVVLHPDEKRVEQENRRTKYQQASTIIFQALTTAIIVYQTFFRN